MTFRTPLRRDMHRAPFAYQACRAETVGDRSVHVPEANPDTTPNRPPCFPSGLRGNKPLRGPDFRNPGVPADLTTADRAFVADE
jgi:hypothetical protein